MLYPIPNMKILQLFDKDCKEITTSRKRYQFVFDYVCKSNMTLHAEEIVDGDALMDSIDQIYALFYNTNEH